MLVINAQTQELITRDTPIVSNMLIKKDSDSDDNPMVAKIIPENHKGFELFYKS